MSGFAGRLAAGTLALSAMVLVTACSGTPTVSAPAATAIPPAPAATVSVKPTPTPMLAGPGPAATPAASATTQPTAAPPTAGYGASESPADAASAWIGALVQNNKSDLTKRTCLTLRGASEGSLKLPATAQSRPLLALLVGGGWNVVSDQCPSKRVEEQVIRNDASQLKFVVAPQQGDEAQVSVSGQLVQVCVYAPTVTVASSSFQTQTWQMTKEDGMWRWCGVK